MAGIMPMESLKLYFPRLSIACTYFEVSNHQRRQPKKVPRTRHELGFVAFICKICHHSIYYGRSTKILDSRRFVLPSLGIRLLLKRSTKKSLKSPKRFHPQTHNLFPIAESHEDRRSSYLRTHCAFHCDFTNSNVQPSDISTRESCRASVHNYTAFLLFTGQYWTNQLYVTFRSSAISPWSPNRLFSGTQLADSY